MTYDASLLWKASGPMIFSHTELARDAAQSDLLAQISWGVVSYEVSAAYCCIFVAYRNAIIIILNYLNLIVFIYLESRSKSKSKIIRVTKC